VRSKGGQSKGCRGARVRDEKSFSHRRFFPFFARTRGSPTPVRAASFKAIGNVRAEVPEMGSPDDGSGAQSKTAGVTG
jgi:hypothetical protein